VRRLRPDEICLDFPAKGDKQKTVRTFEYRRSAETTSPGGFILNGYF
jgi:hypothetical protein